MASANAVAGKITEPANPAPRVAIAPIKERRSLNAGPDSRFSRFSDAIPTPICRAYRSRLSITEIVYLSIKIALGDPIKTYKLSRKTILNIGGVVKLILGKQVRMTCELDDFDTLNWPT